MNFLPDPQGQRSFRPRIAPGAAIIFVKAFDERFKLFLRCVAAWLRRIDRRLLRLNLSNHLLLLFFGQGANFRKVFGDILTQTIKQAFEKLEGPRFYIR